MLGGEEGRVNYNIMRNVVKFKWATELIITLRESFTYERMSNSTALTWYKKWFNDIILVHQYLSIKA